MYVECHFSLQNIGLLIVILDEVCKHVPLCTSLVLSYLGYHMYTHYIHYTLYTHRVKAT